MSTSISWEFQPKAIIISLEKMSQPVPLFTVTRDWTLAKVNNNQKKVDKNFLIP